MATFDSDPIKTAVLRTGYRRADVELHGIDQAVPSYEGRIFLGNAGADENTPRDEDSGFLGSFFVFGKLECWGEEGHCEPPERVAFDRRRDPTRWAKARVRVPEGRLARVLEGAGDEPKLSIVAVVPRRPDYDGFKPEDVLRFDRLSIVTYA